MDKPDLAAIEAHVHDARFAVDTDAAAYVGWNAAPPLLAYARDLEAQVATLRAALTRLSDATDRVYTTVGPHLEHIHEPGVERLAAVSEHMLALLDARAVLTEGGDA